MRALVDALSETRPKSPASQVDNDEPIELAHYPDAMKPPPGAKPPIERDDFPAPPYPYTDPERRRRWSDTYKVPSRITTFSSFFLLAEKNFIRDSNFSAFRL